MLILMRYFPASLKGANDCAIKMHIRLILVMQCHCRDHGRNEPRSRVLVSPSQLVYRLSCRVRTAFSARPIYSNKFFCIRPLIGGFLSWVSVIFHGAAFWLMNMRNAASLLSDIPAYSDIGSSLLYILICFLAWPALPSRSWDGSSDTSS